MSNVDFSQKQTTETRSAQAKQATIDAVAAERYTHEVAGTAMGGVAVFTDRTTQMKLTAASVRASQDETYTVDWKTSDGSFVTLTADQILAIANGVGDYVQACYTREATLLAAIDDGTYTESMLSQGWPG